MESNQIGSKLVAVADINNIKLFSAKGLKILEPLANISIVSVTDHKHEKHESLYKKKSAPRSCFAPHTSPKDIKYQESSRSISEHINKVFNDNKDFKSLIIVADPKMLGYIRQHLSDNVKKKVKKEVNKDLMNHSIEEIESTIFK